MRLHPVIGPLCLLLFAGTSIPPRPSHAEAFDFMGHVFDATSGAPVEGATVVIPPLRFGTVSHRDGRFLILGVRRLGEGAELVVRHPCFYTVRVDIASLDPADAFALGLPYRQPRGADGTILPGVCSLYGPRLEPE